MTAQPDIATDVVPEIAVRIATLDDLPALSTVLAQAFFRDDPVGEYIYPKEAMRDRLQVKMLMTLARRRFIPRGEASVALIDGSVVGVILWHGSHHIRLPVQTMLSWPELLWAMRTRVYAGMQIDAALARIHPGVPAITGVYLGCSPEMQSIGVGSALMKDIMARAAAEGVPLVGICKDGNVPYYARFGFQYLGKTRIGRKGTTANVLLRVPPQP